MPQKPLDARQLRLGFAEISKDYALGEKIAAEFPERFPYGAATTIGTSFRRPDLTRDKAEKLRKLAIAYSAEEFRALLSKCEAAAYLPGITLLTRLATLPKRSRDSVEAKMIADRWTKQDLNAEILRRVGRRRSGGRKQKIPEDSATLLVAVERQCHAWIRWGDQVQQESELDETLMRRLKSAERAIKRLHQEVNQRLSAARKAPNSRSRQNESGKSEPGPARRRRGKLPTRASS